MALLKRKARQGQGVAQSDLEATRLFRKAADKEIAEAQHELGIMLARATRETHLNSSI